VKQITAIVVLLIAFICAALIAAIDPHALEGEDE
jgi:hypothetical protein